MTSLGILTVLAALASGSSLEAAPVKVRFKEAPEHAQIMVRSQSGEILGQGDLLQTIDGERVDSRMTLHFQDGSLRDEGVVFTQKLSFIVLSYHLLQRGPSFPETVEVSFDRRTGTYKARSVKDDKVEEASGHIDLPPDVYNGMVVTLLKNLPHGASETVHLVAFLPKPKLIKLEMVPTGTERVVAGDIAMQATRYALKPKLGAILRLLAKVTGASPADQECLFLTKDVPAFVRCDGPFYINGPVWRTEQAIVR